MLFPSRNRREREVWTDVDRDVYSILRQQLEKVSDLISDKRKNVDEGLYGWIHPP